MMPLANPMAKQRLSTVSDVTEPVAPDVTASQSKYTAVNTTSQTIRAVTKSQSPSRFLEIEIRVTSRMRADER
jgi:hypothetical protein